MATIHFLQQGKGGVGKSVIASYLCQVLKHLGKTVVAFDTDPVNASLASYQDFNAVRVDIVQNGQIDTLAFDSLLEKLYELPEDAHAVVDNGASSFLVFGNYIREIDLIQELAERGDQVFFHSVIMAGESLSHTLSGLKVLADGFPTTPLVVWLNPHDGEIRMGDKRFEEFKIYHEYAGRFHAILHLPPANKDTLGRDLHDLLTRHQTFEKALASSDIRIAPRLRLKRYWAQIVALIEHAQIAG
jgi:ATPases involved in chromosome partitioning